MEKKIVKLPNWPFKSGEVAKLIKISKPYLKTGKWIVESKFLSLETQKVVFIKHHFGDLHLLILEAEYVDGVLCSDQKWQIKDLRIVTGTYPVKLYLVKDKYNTRFDHYTIGVWASNQFFIIPLIEIMRAVLAPDVFWLNQITMMDSIDTRMVCDYFEDRVCISFSSEVPVRYASLDPTIMHICWVYTNPDILKMIQGLYQNLREGKGILFDYLMKDLSITVKCEKIKNMNFVREIIACKRKRIFARAIEVNHPGLYEYTKDGDGSSNGRFVKGASANGGLGQVQLTSEAGAKRNAIEFCDFGAIKSEYSTSLKIKRNRKKKSGGATDEPIEGYTETAKGSIRTTGDYGGVSPVPQLEFSNIIGFECDGKFGEILKILREMEKFEEIASVRFHVGDLKTHRAGRAVCSLDDIFTPRRYCVGYIELMDGREAVIIEVDKPNLSTWLLISTKGKQKWNKICHHVITRFVEKSGVWPEAEEVKNLSIKVVKYRHTVAKIREKTNRLLNDIKCL